MIERGRWKKIVPKYKTCLHCQVLEDDYHVVIVCPMYTVIRKQYIKPYYTEKPCMFKFTIIPMNNSILEWFTLI